jgi:hypothetical protein
MVPWHAAIIHERGLDMPLFHGVKNNRNILRDQIFKNDFSI